MSSRTTTFTGIVTSCTGTCTATTGQYISFNCGTSSTSFIYNPPYQLVSIKPWKPFIEEFYESVLGEME